MSAYRRRRARRALAFLLVAPLVHFLYAGPYFAVAQSVSPPRARATATAILVFIGTIIGYGVGPPLVGLANDFFASHILAGQGLDRVTACADAANAAVCADADATGIRYALIAMLGFLVWAAIHFLLAGRTFARDRES